MNKAWTTDEPTNPDAFLKKLISRAESGRVIAYHGTYEDFGCIRSSLDVQFEKKKIHPSKRLDIETRLLEDFVQETYPHLPPGAHRHIELAHLKWKSHRNLGTLYVGRHYGLPSRGIDWTFNHLIGLFFACRRDFDKNGVIWWMNYDEFLKRVAEQWKDAYKKKENVENDIEEDFKRGIEKNILTPFHYPDWMDRPRLQEAWITFSLQYDIHHDESIIHRLGLKQCGRIIVRAELKHDLLNILKRWGVTGASLGIGDECVEIIRAGVVKKLFET
jgi:hypothetical protein